MSNPRILIVEDNSDNRTLLTDILEAMGYTVIEAVDGEEGIEKAAQEHPELILMDLSLPHMDGWAAASHIKSSNELNKIPIIALTAHAMVGDREKALTAGCDDYITKPIDLAELKRKLAQYLG